MNIHWFICEILHIMWWTSNLQTDLKNMNLQCERHNFFPVESWHDGPTELRCCTCGYVGPPYIRKQKNKVNIYILRSFPNLKSSFVSLFLCPKFIPIESKKLNDNLPKNQRLNGYWSTNRFHLRNTLLEIIKNSPMLFTVLRFLGRSVYKFWWMYNEELKIWLLRYRSYLDI